MVRIATTEILVHVSASSRPCDDARYRKEAQEYMRFEAGCRHTLHDTRAEGGISGAGSFTAREEQDHAGLDLQSHTPRAPTPSQSLNQEPKRAVPERGPLESKNGPFGISGDGGDTREAGTSSLGPLIVQEDKPNDVGVALPNPPPRASSPPHSSSRNKIRPLSKNEPQNSHLELETPKVARTFSRHPPISATPAVLNPRRSKFQSHIDVARTPASPPRPQTAPGNRICVQESPLPRRTQSDSWETPPGVIPDSQPSLPHLKRPSTASQSSRTHDSSSPGNPKRVRVNPSSSATETTSRVQVCSSPLILPASLEPHRSPSPLASPPPNLPSDLLPPSSSPPSSDPDSTSIRAPVPKPSNLPFTTHLTPCLALLVTHLPLLTYYTRLQLRPPLRVLHVLERGHWAFPIRSFPTSIWEGFWAYLKAFIGEGRASWGVWCVVEEGNDRNDDDNSGDKDRKLEQKKKPTSTPSSSANARVCKLYCWGEIVPEIWLLLFIASHRQIKGCRAQWIDAGGEAVIQMK